MDTHDFNIFTVDWSVPASGDDFVKVVGRIGNVGKKISKFIDILLEKQYVTRAEIHLIGHSLGAHLMGVAGATIKEGKVARITGKL